MAECLVIKGLCTMRATRLDPVTGGVDGGPDNYSITESQISMALTADIEAGTESNQKNGCGVIQASDAGEDIFKRWSPIALSMAKFEPAFIEILTGAEVAVDGGGEPVGVIGANELATGFTRPLAALECWTKLFDGDAQSGTRPWGYILLVASQWRLGDMNFAEEFTPVLLSGKSRTNASWSNGPYGDTGFDDVVETWAIAMLENDPPDATCGYATVAATS